MLRPSFVELCRLFVYYCNTPPQGEADLSPPPPEVHAQRSRMSSPHWLALAHDLRLGDALRLGEVVHMNTHELSDERLQWLFLSRTPGGLTLTRTRTRTLTRALTLTLTLTLTPHP